MKRFVFLFLCLANLSSFSAQEESPNKECFICLGEVSSDNSLELSCRPKHTYHTRCLLLWYAEKVAQGQNEHTCPMCTTRISDSDFRTLQEKSNDFCCFCCPGPRLNPVQHPPEYLESNFDDPLSLKDIYYLGWVVKKTHIECLFNALKSSSQSNFISFSQRNNLMEQVRRSGSIVGLGRKTTEYQNLYEIITYPLFLHYNLSQEDLSYFFEYQFQAARVLTSIALVVFVLYGVNHLNVASEAKDKSLVSFIPLVYIFLLINLKHYETFN